ncbi:arachidonate 5-lipoxygenase-like [Paramuricea clavata]|uniref:Arachidonate 5-lipoxygenase-like n=1 Tax=Paramuricea clavata TaxID=317549 RepID=A0A7D9JIZ2_PARCT|nr:arachidonate 5-lipoxygenase-like [Paramuricea clavata]
MAKEEIQRADITYTELIEHLLKTHIVMEPICVIMRRTLSFFHPLHQIFKWHCRGLFVTNSLGIQALLKPGEFLNKLFTIGHVGGVELLNKAYPSMSWADTEFDKNLEIFKWHCRGLFVTNSLGIQALLNPGEFLNKLFTIGHVGGVELLNKAYPSMSWADTEFDKNLETRGVDSVDELPYFPYRDDGLLIWKDVGDFAGDYVRLYYQKDEDVKQDTELRNFANQLSADGTGKNGGIGLFKGFPVKIETRSHLIDVVRRIVFIPIQHHAVNYPVAYYGAFVPNLPTKLYDDPRVPPREFGFDSLPQVHVAAEQVSLSMSLGSIRYDVIFDYGKYLKDDRAKAVVNKCHDRLIGGINDQISARNQKRLANGKLSYPYLLPKWMPNSIHT